MVETYYEIGRVIVVEEQNGSERAEYGKQILIELSNKLTKEFGLGFSVTNLQQMKNFYSIYGKQQTLSAKSDIMNYPVASGRGILTPNVLAFYSSFLYKYKLKGQ